MLKDMDKIRIIGPKSRMPAVIEKLHELKVLHIVEKKEDAGQGRPLMTAEKISEALVKVKAIASQLNIPLAHSHADKTVEEAVQDTHRIAEDLSVLHGEVKGIDEHLKNLLAMKQKAIIAEQLNIEDLPHFESIEVLIGYVRDAASFEEKLRQKVKRFHILTSPAEKRFVMALAVEKQHVQAAKSVLAGFDFTSLDLSDMKGKRRTDIEKEIAAFEKKQLAAWKNLADLKKDVEKKVPAYENMLSEELAKAEIPLRFKETKDTFIVNGFVPADRTSLTVESINELTDNRCIIQVHKADSHHDSAIPVVLKNPRPVSSFQFFLDLYTLPKYKEIDPTWFIFITFPLLFGFMLGDMGYGLVCLILFFILKKAMPKFRSFFNILIFASVGTIIFGAVFGEFFGYEPFPALLSRSPEHDLNPLMIAAIFAGIVHVNAGLVVGFVNELRSHGFKRAFLEKFGWFFLEGAAVLLGLSYGKVISLSPFVGYGVLALSVIILYLGEGARGIVEIPSIFGNILSYLRLMAIGLSSVGLALVINDLAGGFFKAGGFQIIAGVLILVIGHVINIGIGILGGFLHSLRLHYVELFSKFYKGGGITFKPFGVRR